MRQRSVNASTGQNSAIRFGPFQFEPQSGVLRKAGKQIQLQPQPARVLALLVSRPAEVVTREEIRKMIWGEDTFVDFEHSINFSIRQIRTALQDDAQKPRFIETLPRRGYRFLAPIERVSPNGRNAIQSLAVLPLENLSHDPEQEYFADGMTDQLITELARMGAVRVISRTSVQCYKRTRKSLAEVARRLNVDAMVEGTVLRRDRRIRITAQLIDARSEEHLWAESYEQDLDDVFKLQAELAQAIAGQVHSTLAAGPRVRPGPARPVDPLAFDRFLRGRYFCYKRTEDCIRKGIEYFRQAIEADPTYARAYAGLAESYIPLGYWGYLAPGDAFPKARAWALKALEIDDQLPEARAALASVFFLYERDPESARKELQQATRLNPNYPRAHQVYGELLTSLGEFEAAASELRRALELDPLSPLLHGVDGLVSYFARRYEEVLPKCRKSLEIDPKFPLAHYYLGLALAELGQFEDGVEHLQKAVETAPECAWYQADRARAYALWGKEDEARRALHGLENTREEKYVPAYSMAGVYAGLGDRERTLLWLDRANEERSSRMVFLNVDPAFDALRSDPWFQDLLCHAKLPAPGGVHAP